MSQCKPTSPQLWCRHHHRLIKMIASAKCGKGFGPDTGEAEVSECPFIIGQPVIFKPDARTLGQQMMVENLKPGERYKISEIRRFRDEVYIVVEGHPSAGGGLHWSAFAAA